MSDALQVAEQRRKEYKMAISKKENEIVELKERIEDLDNFIEFGQALVAKGGETARTVSRTPQPAQQVQPKPAENKPEANPADDEWGNEDDASPVNKGINRVLSQRTG